jgi:cardiolipin synthase
MHSKTIVADDDYGICGSINFSFRSFHLNYESAVWLYKTKSVLQMRDAFLELLPECTEITKEHCKSTPYLVKVARDVLSIFAPLV